MENAVFTTLCMVSDIDGNVLVQERIGGKWDGIAFPGGHVEQGESFVKSVIREVCEETGYTIESPLLCGIKQFQTDEGSRYVILMFKADKFHGKLASSSEGRAFWIKRDEMQRYNLAHDMLEMMELFENDAKSEFYYYKDMDKWKYEIL